MVLQFSGMVSRWVSTIISYSIILREEIVNCKKSNMQWRCVLFRQKIVILTEDDPGIPKNSLAKSDTNILFLIVIVARYYCTRSLLQEILKGTKIYCAQTYRYLICSNMIFRSSRPEVFSKKGVRRNFAKFTGKHLRQSPETRPATLLKKGLWRRRFPVNFAKFLRTPSLQNTSWRLLQLIDSLFQSFRHKQVFNFFVNL